MPVDKFGRMSDAKTKDTGVSLTYINNNYIRSDGGTPVSGSIDMKGNTLYNVSDPVNPQDVATKKYADEAGGGETAIFKMRYGTFGSKGNIDMRGYTLMNVLDPADAQDVATKKYVDAANRAFVFDKDKYLAVGEVSMGGRRLNNVAMPLENSQAANKFYVDALVEASTAGDKALRKIQDGVFALEGNIDMNGNSITGLPNPVDRDAAVNKNYVDNGGAIAKNPDGSFSAVSDIDLLGYRLKNLSNPKEDRGGLTVTEQRKIFAEEVKVNVTVNGKEQVLESIVKKSGDLCSCTIFNTPIELQQCDVINFVSRTANSKITNAYVSILIELDL